MTASGYVSDQFFACMSLFALITMKTTRRTNASTSNGVSVATIRAIEWRFPGVGAKSTGIRPTSSVFRAQAPASKAAGISMIFPSKPARNKRPLEKPTEPLP